MVTKKFTDIHIKDHDSSYVVLHQTFIGKEEKRWERQVTAVTWKNPMKINAEKEME